MQWPHEIGFGVHRVLQPPEPLRRREMQVLGHPVYAAFLSRGEQKIRARLRVI